MHGMGWGYEHGAQGYGFHRNFHSGPAIVFPSKTYERGLSHERNPAGSKMADMKFNG